MKRSLRLAILIISTACLAKTGNAQEAGKRPVFGTWQFVAYHFGDNISVGPREAKKLLGKKIRYSSYQASFGEDICAKAVYRSSQLSSDEFFREFKTSLKSISIRGTHINLISVRCDGKDWIAPGSLLLRMPNGQMQTVWDGVFHILKKQRNRT